MKEHKKEIKANGNR